MSLVMEEASRSAALLTVKFTVFRLLYQRWTRELIDRMCQMFDGRELDLCSRALAAWIRRWPVVQYCVVTYYRSVFVERTLFVGKYCDLTN